MAQYQTVVWDEGAEVTSQKLQQMASNEQWLKDNIILGNMNWYPNPLGEIAEGRTKQVQSATKLEVIEYRFNSQVLVSQYDFNVPLPPVFTQPPMIVASIYTTFEDLCMRRLAVGRTDFATFRVWHTDRLTKHMYGDITVMAFGV